MKNRKHILRGLCIAVLLLIVSALCSGCIFPFSIIGNWGYVRAPGVSIEVVNFNGDPVTYLSQPNNITCAATTACMIGNFYGLSWYTSDADILQVHDFMTNGNPNRRATYGEFVSYCQMQFLALNWATIGAGTADGIINSLPDVIEAGDPATLDGGTAGDEHILPCVGLVYDSNKYYNPVFPEKYVTDLIVADPLQRGRWNGGMTLKSRNDIATWMVRHSTAQGNLYLTFHRVNFYKSPLPEGLQYVTTQSIASGHQDSYELQPLLRNRPWEDYEIAFMHNDDAFLPPAPDNLADTMTCVALVLMQKSGLLNDVAQFPWLADVLANSEITQAFQVDKLGQAKDMPDYRWYCQVITHTGNGSTLTVGETVFDYDRFNRTITPKWCALFATPYSDGIPQYSKRATAHILSADAYNRKEDVQRKYPGSTAIPFNMAKDEWPGSLKWHISGGDLAEPIIMSRGGLQMVWDITRQDFVFLEDLKHASDRGPIPSEFQLSQNFPNPFNPTTTIRFSLPAQVPWTLDVVNILGQTIQTYIGEGIGSQQVSWDAQGQSSGVYFYRLMAGDFTETKKMVLLK
ncbi:MAG: T9SS type A sorting domain-containing protein [Patescibacteria group bacterium]|jgi:hypothetical protein